MQAMAETPNACCRRASSLSSTLPLKSRRPTCRADMVYCHFPLTDGPQDDPTILRVAIQTVATLLKSQVPTLVYCGAGMSRSPAIVAAALSIVQGGNPEDKLKEIVAGHPHDVSPQLWEAVRLWDSPKGLR